MSDKDKRYSDNNGSDDNKQHRRNSDDHKENPDHHHHRHHHHHHGRHSSDDKGRPEENRTSFESDKDRKESNYPQEESPGPSSQQKPDPKRADPGKPTEKDERKVSKEKDERKVSADNDERKVSVDKGERKVSKEKDERKVSADNDERKVSVDKGEQKVSKEKDERKVSNDAGDVVKKAGPKMLLYEAHNKLRKHYHRHHHRDPAKEPEKEIKLPKLRSSKFWEQSSKSKQKVQSQHGLHRIKKRKNRLEKLLHVLDSMDKPPADPQMLTALKYYGIPDQHKLFGLLYDKEAIPASFGDNMRMYLSHVLRTRCCYNFYNCYNLLPRLRPTIQAIRFKGVKPHPQEFVNTERVKAAHRRKALHSIQSIALDEGHAAYMKQLTINQLASLPVTVMHEVLNEKIKVVEQMCYKYSDLAGSSSTTAKIAMSHYNLMKKHLEAFEFIGLQSLPPLCVYRKFEEGPKEENAFITSSSSSEDEEELETFIQRDVGPTAEELAEQALEEEDNRILQMAVEMNAEKMQ